MSLLTEAIFRGLKDCELAAVVRRLSDSHLAKLAREAAMPSMRPQQSSPVNAPPRVRPPGVRPLGGRNGRVVEAVRAKPATYQDVAERCGIKQRYAATILSKMKARGVVVNRDGVWSAASESEVES